MATEHAGGRTRVAAYGVARRSDGAILLVRASATSGSAGSWWLPGGGIRFGEHPRDAVVREVAEETGLSVAVAGPPTVLSDAGELADGTRIHTVRLCYPVRVLDGTLRDEPAGSTDAAAWVPADDVPHLALAPFVRSALGLPG